ncbi:MAG: hypothetical protein KDC44_02815, partial [Phaeodactylibacter sp.]|nr:hypothetical protein [Phaeodactylibacter sp.]
LILTLFVSCDQTTPQAGESAADETAMGTKAEVTCGSASSCPSIPSSMSCLKPASSYELENDCADNFTCRYDSVLVDICNETKGSDNMQYLVKGFEVAFDELREVYDSATAMGSQVKVFTMLGINENDSTDMVFVLEITNGGTTTARSFDFTTPCPPACPTE